MRRSARPFRSPLGFASLRAGDRLLCALAVCLAAAGCSPYEIQWDSSDQIWLSESSQVKVRAAQTRVFDTHDRVRMLEAVVATFQDLDFQVELVDETLGIVSGKKFADLVSKWGLDPSYYLYDEESLVVFTKSYRTWGPFWHRSDLVRLTVTVRERNPTQLLVRAAAQYYLRPLEDPEPYQQFFRTLEQALFSERQLAGKSSSR